MAAHWHALANFVPILDNRRTIVHLTKEQVFYTGWSLVYSEDEIQATQSPFPANWDLIYCKPCTDLKSILHHSDANRKSNRGHSKLNIPVQQQSSNKLISANPCRHRPIRANPCQCITQHMSILENQLPIPDQSAAIPAVFH